MEPHVGGLEVEGTQQSPVEKERLQRSTLSLSIQLPAERCTSTRSVLRRLGHQEWWRSHSGYESAVSGCCALANQRFEFGGTAMQLHTSGDHGRYREHGGEERALELHVVIRKFCSNHRMCATSFEFRSM